VFEPFSQKASLVEPSNAHPSLGVKAQWQSIKGIARAHPSLWINKHEERLAAFLDYAWNKISTNEYIIATAQA
jgi:hypothetical protein